MSFKLDVLKHFFLDVFWTFFLVRFSDKGSTNTKAIGCDWYRKLCPQVWYGQKTVTESHKVSANRLGMRIVGDQICYIYWIYPYHTMVESENEFKT